MYKRKKKGGWVGGSFQYLPRLLKLKRERKREKREREG
jgi:hypothetical protein